MRGRRDGRRGHGHVGVLRGPGRGLALALETSVNQRLDRRRAFRGLQVQEGREDNARGHGYKG